MLYNFQFVPSISRHHPCPHTSRSPGSTVGAATPETSIALIAKCINRAHKETSTVITVLENMAGSGNVIGGDFSHLAKIISKVEDKTRVGVCLDTCKYRSFFLPLGWTGDHLQVICSLP